MTPKYADYDKETKVSIIKTVRSLTHIDFIFISTKEVYIHCGRRKLLSRALDFDRNRPIDYFFWIDSDVWFDPDDVSNLIALCENKHLVTGLYFSRHSLRNPMVCFGDSRNGYQWSLPKNWQSSPFKVDGCGFGFVMMSRKMVHDYIRAYPSTEWFQSKEWYPSNGHPDAAKWVVGEDLHFCKNSSKIGYPVWCHPRIILQHKGIGLKDYLNVDKNPKPHCEVEVEILKMRNIL